MWVNVDDNDNDDNDDDDKGAFIIYLVGGL